MRSGRVFVVTVGAADTKPLAYFTTRERAELYVQDLLKRYREGTKLALNGKQLAPKFGEWVLGFGPQVHEHDLDPTIEYLPGAWTVRVNEAGHLLGATFTFDRPPQAHGNAYQRDRMVMAEGFGRAPRDAADKARAALARYVAEPPSRHR